MSTPNPDNTAPTAADVERLTKALESERAEHKATKAKASERRVALATSLGLPDTSNDDEIIARLGTIGKPDAVAAVERERDDARAKFADLESRWSTERIDAAIQSALSKSGMDDRNHEDAANILRPLLTMKDGEVVTKEGAVNIIPGQTPDQFVHAQLKTMRGHWWPLSIGGGAKGGTNFGDPNGLPGDPSCFDPRSPNFNVTKQGQYHRAYGPDATARAQAKFGGER